MYLKRSPDTICNYPGEQIADGILFIIDTLRAKKAATRLFMKYMKSTTKASLALFTWRNVRCAKVSHIRTYLADQTRKRAAKTSINDALAAEVYIRESR